jgi:hypothetical protein
VRAAREARAVEHAQQRAGERGLRREARARVHAGVRAGGREAGRGEAVAAGDGVDGGQHHGDPLGEPGLRAQLEVRLVDHLEMGHAPGVTRPQRLHEPGPRAVGPVPAVGQHVGGSGLVDGAGRAVDPLRVAVRHQDHLEPVGARGVDLRVERLEARPARVGRVVERGRRRLERGPVGPEADVARARDQRRGPGLGAQAAVVLRRAGADNAVGREVDAAAQLEAVRLRRRHCRRARRAQGRPGGRRGADRLPSGEAHPVSLARCSPRPARCAASAAMAGASRPWRARSRRGSAAARRARSGRGSRPAPRRRAPPRPPGTRR